MSIINIRGSWLMQTTALFTTAFVVGLSGAMMPGPLLTATMVSSAERGWGAGPLIVLGHALLELALVAALLAGIAQFLVQPRVTTVIALVGGVFLVYLGITMIRDVWSGRLSSIQASSTDGSASAPVSMHPVLAGILISLFNPYWSIWWATVGLGYLTFALNSGLSGITSFFSGHILSDLAWYTLVAIAVSKGQALLSPRVYKGLLVGCGLFMLGLGIYFFYSGLTT
ncbi:MAG: LysE family transporter [Syntrophomonadaceae bacterium]|jgi:threonine/homoserine/homoserine lactone efflux protein